VVEENSQQPGVRGGAPAGAGLAVAPRRSSQAVERLLCELWSTRFGCPVTALDDFYALGGDSIMMIEFVGEARERGLPLRSSTAMRNPTPARMAESLTLPRDAASRAALAACVPALFLDQEAAHAVSAAAWSADDVRAEPIVAGEPAEPVYVVHSTSQAEAEREALGAWARTRAAFGFELPGARGRIPPFRSVADLADRYLSALVAAQPAGPYRLIGFGFGAAVAYEIACRLRAAAENVAFLGLVDAPGGPGSAETTVSVDELTAQRCASLAGRFALTGEDDLAAIRAKLREGRWYDDAVRAADLPRLQLAWSRLAAAVREFRYADYGGRGVLVLDGPGEHPVEHAWTDAGGRPRVLKLDHGLASSQPVLRDPLVAQTMREALDA
jgi:thioesterase domain-containing protein